MSAELIAVTITAPNKDQLTNLCRELIKFRLAASANIIPTVKSVYWWEDETHEHQESLAMLHTQSDLFERLCQEVRRNHPYVIPQIVALPIRSTLESYGAWIFANTSE